MKTIQLMGRAAVLMLALAALGGCGNFYSAEIQGFVQDSQDDGGINGATVRFYVDEPSAADAEGFFARTSTSTSNNQQGYFRNSVVWNAWFSSYGPEGDSGTVYLGVTHEDYAPAIIEVPGVLSDTVNTVENVRLDRVSFEVPTVKGRVVDINGDGVNGVRIELDLSSTTDTDQDYVVVTGDEPEGAGYYVFDTVSWRDDAHAGDTTDDEAVTIRVDDSDWESASQLSITLTSGQDRTVATDLQVTRQPRSEFATNVSGRVIDVVNETEIPKVGVGIRITLQGTNDVVYTQTGATGQFTVRVEWTDSSPKDFDGDGDIGDAADDASIPEGEDGLLVAIDYDLDGDAAYNDHSIASYQLKSWINPNYAPDWDPVP